jgi:hypothetical protein
MISQADLILNGSSAHQLCECEQRCFEQHAILILAVHRGRLTDHVPVLPIVLGSGYGV